MAKTSSSRDHIATALLLQKLKKTKKKKSKDLHCYVDMTDKKTGEIRKQLVLF